MSEARNHLSDIAEGESLTFSAEQIEYLRAEFERQRRWVNLLSTREKTALEELERTQNSLSYRVGRFLTWLPRKIEKILKSRNKKIVYFVQEDEETKEEELFPSTLLITPELLPTSSASRKADSLIEEILIGVRRGSVTVNQIRDTFSEGSFSMSKEEQTKAAFVIMDHMLSSAQYGPSVKNVFVGILRSLTNSNFGGALEFGENYIDQIPDERGIRTLIQLHGKGGNFSRPIELLKLMPKSPRKEQEQKFITASNILENGLDLTNVNQNQSNLLGRDNLSCQSKYASYQTGYALERTAYIITKFKGI